MVAQLRPGPVRYQDIIKPGSSIPQPANVKLKKLPFYDIHGELLPPTSFLAQVSSRF